MTALMQRRMILGAMVLACGVHAAAWSAGPAEERIRGTLEKTARPGACAQITDALKETYFLSHSAEAQKACADLFGRKVLVTGVVDVRPGTEDYYFTVAKIVPLDGSPVPVSRPPAAPPAGDATAPLPPAPPDKGPSPPNVPSVPPGSSAQDGAEKGDHEGGAASAKRKAEPEADPPAPNPDE